MATVRPTQDIEPLTIRFGYGLNTQATDTVIDDMECANGSSNFRLDLGNVEFRPRLPFDLRGTAPGSGAIDGFAQLRKRDGTLSTLIQRGTDAYVWDGSLSGFTNTGFTLSAGTRLRGKPREHAWLLDERVLISDLGLQMDVLQWDGTTLSAVDFKKSDNSDFGTMRAKYIYVTGERAHYGNVVTSTATPHMLVGSKLSEYAVVADTGTATDGADPFFVLSPDLKPINGALGAFGLKVISTENGSMFQLLGSNATDLRLEDLHLLTAVRGEEALVNLSNDVGYGMEGRLEKLGQGNTLGKYLAENLAYHIEPSITGVSAWTVVYNRRRHFGYFFPQGRSECFGYDRKIANTTPDRSPWAPMKTLHPLAFQPTCTWSMFDPVSGLEEVYMGDSSGNIYQFEGVGSGDGGTADIRAERTSRIFSVSPAANAYDVDGWIYYRKEIDPSEIQVEIQWSGETVNDQQKNIFIPGRGGGIYYKGPIYYNGPIYYGASFGGRISRQGMDITGSGSDFAIKLSSEGSEPFCVERVVLRFRVAG